MTPVVMFDEAIIRTSDEAQALIPTLLTPLWSMASGVTLVALLCTCNKRQRLDGDAESMREENVARILETCKTDANSSTNFVPLLSTYFKRIKMKCILCINKSRRDLISIELIC